MSRSDTSTESVRRLCAQHDLFADLFARNGAPPQWRRTATFGTLIRFILEQQVSLASAQAAFKKLEVSIGAPHPTAFLALDDAELRSIGFSRQKAGYVRGIAVKISSGELDLDRIVAAGDVGIATLLDVRGIGPWTVACFELFVAGRPDVWPTGDRALYVSLARNLGFEHVPSKDVCDEIASAWSPYRSSAARMLWHDYLGGRSYVLDADAGFVVGTGNVSG